MSKIFLPFANLRNPERAESRIAGALLVQMPTTCSHDFFFKKFDNNTHDITTFEVVFKTFEKNV